MSSEKKEHWINNNWVVGIGLLLLTPLINLVIDLFKTVPSKTMTFWNTLKYSLEFIVSYDLKVWWIFCAIITIILIKFIYKKIKLNAILIDENGELTEMGVLEADRQNETANKKQHIMLQYTADKFLHYTWEWRWLLNSKINKWEPKFIAPCCSTPKCNLKPMKLNTDSIGSAYYDCSNCNDAYVIRKYHLGNIEDEIKSYIAINLLKR